MILLPVLIPAGAAVIAFFIRAHRVRRLLLAATAALHSLLVAWMWVDPSRFPALGDWMAADGLGRLFLGITSALFLAVALYAVGFLRRESGSTAADPGKGSSSPTPPRRYSPPASWDSCPP